MPIDRHTSGDNFDRSDDARVNETDWSLRQESRSDRPRDTEAPCPPRRRQVSEAAGQQIIWPLLALGLAACGGGTNTLVKTSGPGPGSLTSAAVSESLLRATNVMVHVVDGPLKGAKVYLSDADGNPVGEMLGYTDSNGELDLSKLDLTATQRTQILSNGLVVTLDGARDMSTGETYEAGTLRSVPGNAFNIVSPLTTLIVEAMLGTATDSARDDAAQCVIDTLFGADSGITLDMIQSYLSYQVSSSGASGIAATARTSIATMSVRVLETLEEMIHSDNRGGSYAERAQRAVKTLSDRIEAVATENDNREEGTDAKDADDVPGLKSESDVEPQTDNSRSYGSGRPVAVPRKGLTVKSGSEDGLKLTLDDLGFGDIERQEEFGAVTFTALPGVLGELSYISVATGRKTVVTADTKIIIADVQGGVFTFVPTANVIGEITFTYEVEAKAVGKDYDAGNPVDGGMEKSTSATLSISVTAESGGEIVIAEQTDKDGRADDEAPHPGDRLRADVVVEDGADIAYQWVARTGPTADWQPLAGHTTRYYVVRDADVGMEIGVRVQRDGGPAFTLLEGVVSSLGLQTATEAQASGPRSPDLVAFAREVDAGWQDDAGAEKSIHLGAGWSSYALVDNDTNGANDIIATYDVRIYQLPLVVHGGPIAAADKISGFRSGDKIRLRADGAAEDATDVTNVYYAWADLNDDGVANDLVLYGARSGGDSNVYGILMDWGVEGGSTPPTNSAFWENVSNIEKATRAATTADRSAAQEIAYSLATEGPDHKIINHNHLVKEITDGKVVFKAGAFDHEHPQLLVDGTGRYVLIQIGRTVNRVLETVNLKIYVTNINDGVTDIGLDDDIPDFELPEAPADNARQQERDAHAAQVAALTAKQSSLILPLSGGVYDGSEVVIGALWVSDPDSVIGPGTRIVFGGDDAGLFTARWDSARGPEGSLILVYTGGTAGVAGRKPGDSFDLTVLQIIDDQEGGVPGAASAVRVLETPHALPLVLNGVKAHDSDAATPDKVQVGAAPTGGPLKVRELDFAAVPKGLIDTTDADDDDILDNFRVLNPDGTENTDFHVRYENNKFYLYQIATVDTMPDGGVIDLVVVPNLRKVVPGADWYVAHDADGGVNGFIAIEFNIDLSRLIADKPSSAYKQHLHIPDSGPLELSFYHGSDKRQMKSLTVEHGDTSGIAWSPSSPTTLTVTLGPGERTFGKLAELIWGSADAIRLLGLEAGRRDPVDNSYLKAKLWRLQVEEDGGVTAQADIAVEGALVAINPGRLPSSVRSVKYVEITSGQSSVDVDVQDFGGAGYRIAVTFSLLTRERTIDKVLELLQDLANKPVADLWRVTDTTTTQQLRGILELDSASEINAAGEIQGRASRSIQRDPNTGRVVINQNTGEPVFVSGPKTLDVGRVDIPQDAQSSLVAPTINAPGLNVRLSITEGTANSLVWDDATRTATITLVKDDDIVESLRNLLVGHDVVPQLMGLAGTDHGQGHDPVSPILSRLQLRVDEADRSQPREALLISLTGGRIHNLVPGRNSGEISFTGATFDLMKFKDDGGNRVPVTLYISRDDGGGWSLKIIKSSEIGNARDHATAPGLAAGADGNDDAQEPAIFHYIVGHIAANGFTISWPDGATAFDAFNYDLIGLTPAPMAVQVPVVNLDGAGDNARADLSGVAGVADIFTIDADAGNAAGADTIAGFDPAADKLRIDDGTTAQEVYVVMDSGDAVIYADQANAVAGNDAGILAILDNTVVTVADFGSNDFSGTGVVTVVHVGGVDSIDGSSAGKQVMVGVDTTADTFKVDAAAASAKSEADVIAGFENGTDLIDLGAITDIVLAEDNGDTVVYTSEAERTSGDGTGVLFVVAGVTGLTAADFDDDDFVQDNINITFPDVS